MSFLLFQLATATLFLRPADFLPELAQTPIYEWLMISLMIVSLPRLLGQISWKSIRQHPITACVFGVLASIVLAETQHSFWHMRSYGAEFAKNVIYYLLLVAVVTSPDRLRRLLCFMALCIIVLALVPLGQQFGWWHLDRLEILQQREIDPETGLPFLLPRLQGTGIFNDPNDLAMMVSLGIMLSLIECRRSGALGSAFWMGAVGLLGYALYATQSRGGMVSLAASLVGYAAARFGWRKAMIVVAFGVPVLASAYSSRMTNFNLEQGTGQARLQLWSEGLSLLRTNALVGVGYDHYAEKVGQVAHNSFLHAYVELGLIGGSCFFGAFALAAWMLWPGRGASRSPTEPYLDKLRPCLFGIVLGQAAGMCTLSRCYVVTTYLTLALATAWASQAGISATWPAWRWNGRMVVRLSFASAAFLALIYLSLRLLVRWS